VSDLVAGREEVLMLRSDGALYGWGNNGYSQLDSGAQSYGVHAAFANIPAVAHPASGWSTGCVVGTDHTVWCFGDNTDGECGDGTVVSPYVDAVQTLVQRTPSPVGLAADQLSLGYYHSCSLGGGVVSCWGTDTEFEAGVPSTGLADAGNTAVLLATPLATQPPSPTAIVAGGFHTCTLDGADGSVWCWGDDEYGQLGDGGTVNSATPIHAASTSGVAQISLGAAHTCARLPSGQLNCWGDNTYGQTNKANMITDAIDVAAGANFTCAIRTGGEVWCWGTNDYGQLAKPLTTTRMSTPSDTNFGGAVKIVAGEEFICALTTAKEVWCWGEGLADELGQDPGPTDQSSVPLRVPVPCP
jgi:alpha-tubulin suppressor-like RCC1 family protein